MDKEELKAYEIAKQKAMAKHLRKQKGEPMRGMMQAYPDKSDMEDYRRRMAMKYWT